MNLVKISILALAISSSVNGFSQAKVRGSLVTKPNQALGSSATLKPYGKMDWGKCSPKVLSSKQIKQLSIPINEPYGFCHQNLPGSHTTFHYTGNIEAGEVNLLMSVSQEDCGGISKGLYKIWNLMEMFNTAQSTILDNKSFDGKDYKINTELPIRAYRTGFNDFKLLVVPVDTLEGTKFVALIRNSNREFHIYAQEQSLESLLSKVQARFNKIF